MSSYSEKIDKIFSDNITTKTINYDRIYTFFYKATKNALKIPENSVFLKLQHFPPFLYIEKQTDFFALSFKFYMILCYNYLSTELYNIY